MIDHELLSAVMQGDSTKVKELVAQKPESVNFICEESGKSLFEIALEAGYSNIATTLLKSEEFDLNLPAHNPLRITIALGYIELAKELLNLGANPNYRPEQISSSLLLCLENEYFDLAQLMVDKGAEVDIRNNKGWTPLIWTSIKGRKLAVDFLIKNGANINICNNDGWNAITGAYFKNRKDIVNILSKEGAVFSARFSEAALLSSYQSMALLWFKRFPSYIKSQI